MKGTEATYVIPLRREMLKVAKYDRLKKAVIATRSFVEKHAKSSNIWLGPNLNTKLHEHGRKNVANKVHVQVINDEGKVKVELVGFPITLEKEKREAEKKDAKKGKKEVKVEEPEKAEEKKEEKKPEVELPKKALEKEIKTAPDKKVAEKVRHEKIVSKDEKPTHEKKK